MSNAHLEQEALTASPTLPTPPPGHQIDTEVDIEVLKVVPRQFAITDENTANWLVRRIVAARQYSAAVKEFAEKEKRRADREEMTLLFLFGRQIESWARGEIEKLGGRRKSITLPAGTLGYRHENLKLVVDDEDALLVWARHECPQAIQSVETVLKSEVNQHFLKTGELPAGTTVQTEREKFYIK